MLGAAARLCATRALSVVLTAAIALLPAQVLATAVIAAVQARLAPATSASLPVSREPAERGGRLRDSVEAGELQAPPSQETRLERALTAIADLPELRRGTLAAVGLAVLATLPLVAAGIWLAATALAPLCAQWRRKGRLSAPESWELLGPRIGPVLSTAALAAALSLLGMFLCALPGLLLLAGFAFAAPVALFEGVQGVAALRRSLNLAQAALPQLVSILAALALLRLLALAIAAVALPREAVMARLLLADCVCTLLFPLPAAALALLYDQARADEAQYMRRSSAPG